MSTEYQHLTAFAGAEMVGPFIEAFRRGWRDGQTRVGTVHVLEELISRLPSVRSRLAPVRREIRALVAAGSSDVSTGTSLIGETTVDNVGQAVELEVEALLREAAWQTRRTKRHKPDVTEPTWTSEVRVVARSALMDAASVGLRYAHAGHLFVAVLEDPANEARALLAQCGVQTDELLRSTVVGKSVGHGGSPWAPTTDVLMAVGSIHSDSGRVIRLLTRAVGNAFAGKLPGGPVLNFIELEAARQAVRLGHPRVGGGHLLLAIAALEQQLRETGRRWAPRSARSNGAGQLLMEWGVTYPNTIAHAALLRRSSGPAAGHSRNRPWRSDSADPEFDGDAENAVALAVEYAKEHDNRHVGTIHLLAALLANEDGSAYELFRASGVDTNALSNRVQYGSSGRSS